MFFSLIVGIVLGAVAVLFILQNTTIVTVAFLTWHIDGSLALILLLALVSGVLITLLILLPSFISDLISLSAIKREKRALEEELLSTKHALVEASMRPPQPETPIL
jgi:lipopolysaccharide assembly protein A